MENAKRRTDRGFIFTLDALFAGAVIVIAAAALFLTYPATEGQDIAYDTVSMKAHDQAIVDFYKGQGSTPPKICGSAEFCRCVEYYTYSSAESLTLNQPQKVCGVYP